MLVDVTFDHDPILGLSNTGVGLLHDGHVGCCWVRSCCAMEGLRTLR